MNNAVKIIRADGRTKNILDVVGCEYKPGDGNTELDIQISDNGENPQQDFFVESVTLTVGDSAYLVNGYGTTIDTIRVK